MAYDIPGKGKQFLNLLNDDLADVELLYTKEGP